MSHRSRRKESGARPGDIINDNKQKCRTQEEIEKDKREKEQAKIDKNDKAAKKRETSARRVAAKEDQLRKQDEQARATAARPDLHTAQLKRSLQSEERPEHSMRTPSPIFPTALAATDTAVPIDHDTSMEDPVTNDELPSDSEFPSDSGDMELDPDSGGDPDYVEPGSQSDPEPHGDSSDEEMDAKLADFAKAKAEYEKAKAARQAATGPAQKSKSGVKKGAIRMEIQEQREQPEHLPRPPAKRKTTESAGTAQAAKRSKAAIGGLKADWQRVVGVEKVPKKSSTSWNRSRSASRASSTSATSGRSLATSGDDFAGGAFDEDEAVSSVAAARAAKGTMNATAKMGITLKKKNIVLDVNGKTKREKQRKYTNADLPFPADGFTADLKFFQETFIPDLIDWAGTLDRPFIATAYPEFKATITSIWEKYFSAYQFDDAVEYMAGAAIGNWRSKIGKTGVKIVTGHIATLDTVQKRRDWVAEQAQDMAFLYRDPETNGGSYRSDLFLRTFGKAHLSIVLKNDVSYGHPTGAGSLVAASLERALSLCRSGKLDPEGVQRKGKKAALNFVAKPWADRVSSYLPPIKTLSLQKWKQIFTLASEYANTKSNPDDDLFDQSSDGDDPEEYVDPRARIVISDDEPEDPAADVDVEVSIDGVVVSSSTGKAA
ncbi:hypothetical protein B0H16DRAFT_1718492 [Mycena metata]|uniref:Uncharacterized protein n=1 Tax=Mycena metata TaxID=1033252 RepID=A0AAD7NIV0_9AGAR|nr:hypothetical protein B0H16DRAFT_1718492 [Mycena metata]